MESLKRLNLTDVTILNRDQLMAIHGGDRFVDDEPIANVCSATCWNSTGSWTYGSPVTYTQCSQDVWAYCATGSGICHGC